MVTENVESCNSHLDNLGQNTLIFAGALEKQAYVCLNALEEWIEKTSVYLALWLMIIHLCAPSFLSSLCLPVHLSFFFFPLLPLIKNVLLTISWVKGYVLLGDTEMQGLSHQRAFRDKWCYPPYLTAAGGFATLYLASNLWESQQNSHLQRAFTSIVSLDAYSKLVRY